MHRIENLTFCLKDVKHRAQPAALLSFLVTDFRQSNSITALWDLWPGIWTGNKAETPDSTVLVIRTVCLEPSKALKHVLPLKHVKESP